MSANPTTFVTPEEYLELELEAEYKSEYFNGEIFAIARPSARHTWIVTNVSGGFWQQLKGKPCRVASNELRLRVTPTGLYTYPDVMVICGNVEVAAEQNDTVLNPVVIVEVLSKSTQDYDRGQKFEHYRTLPSLIDYLTVAQDRPHVVHYTRQSEHSWLLEEFADLGQSIPLPSIGCVLPLAEVYDKIDWTNPSAQPQTP
jgi:Uma2 family endonuclease